VDTLFDNSEIEPYKLLLRDSHIFIEKNIQAFGYLVVLAAILV